MRSMVTEPTIGRRALLWGAAFAFGSALLPGRAQATTRLLVSTARLPDRRFAVVAVEPDGTVRFATPLPDRGHERSEEHTAEIQSLMRYSYAAFCLTTKTTQP